MKQIVLDANFLMIPYQFKVDIFAEIERVMDEEFEIVTLDVVVDELIGLEEKENGRDKRAAKLGRSLLEAKNIRVLKTEKNLNADNQIVNLAKSPDIVVATQDRELKRILRENSAKIIVLRGKNHLELI
ncbi:PIN domain-containing protein [Nanoarchaeota archaeon]